MLLFTLYVHQVTGIWFAWAKTHAAWGRVVGGESPLAAFSGLAPAACGGVRSGPSVRSAERRWACCSRSALLARSGASVRPGRRSCWSGVLVPLSAGGLLSMGRLTSTLFPLFLAAALLLPAGLLGGLTTSFALLQGLLAALFYTWRGVY